MSNNTQFWGKRFGSYSDLHAKNVQHPWGNFIWQLKRGSGASRSDKAKARTMTPMSKAAIKAAAEYRELNGGPYRLYYKSNGTLDKVRTKQENLPRG